MRHGVWNHLISVVTTVHVHYDEHSIHFVVWCDKWYEQSADVWMVY